MINVCNTAAQQAWKCCRKIMWCALPLISVSTRAAVYTIGSGAIPTNTGITPFSTLYEDNRTQYLYLASELAAVGVPPGAVLINSIGFKVTSLGNPAPTDVNISIGTVPAGMTNINAMQAGLNVYFSAPWLSPSIGWNTYTFTSPFLWNGTDNIVVEVCRDNDGFTDLNYDVEGTQFGPGASRTYGFFDDGVTACSMTGGNVPSATDRQTRPNIRFDIVPATGCSGTPPVPSASAPGTVCANTAFTLNATGVSTATGITYQWNAAPHNSGSWTPIPNATTLSYVVASGIVTPMDFQLTVTCSTGGASSTSNDAAVLVSPFYDCYCSPQTGYALENNPQNVILTVAIPGTTLNSSGNNSISTGYSHPDPTVPANTANLHKNESYSINVSLIDGSYTPFPVEGWIDYDQNGTFDAGEYISFAPLSGGTVSSSVTVPGTAVDGPTGMRIRFDGTGFGAAGACGTNGTGETEDYTINIGPPLAIRLSDITAVNIADRNKIEWSTATEDKGDYFVLERSADSKSYNTALATIAGKAQGNNYRYWDVLPLPGTNYYRLKMVDRSGKSAYSKVVTATVAANGIFTIAAYPNPVTEELTIKISGTPDADATISMVDITGRQVEKITVTGNETKINISWLSSGTYFVRYSDKNNNQIIKVNKK